MRILNGNEVMAALGIDPGPEVGRLLAALEEAQASGEIANRKEALAFARKLHGRNDAEPALIGAGGAV